jgi:hypothetical protein
MSHRLVRAIGALARPHKAAEYFPSQIEPDIAK